MCKNILQQHSCFYKREPIIQLHTTFPTMSRIIEESNVAQAMREIVQSIAIVPVGILGIINHAKLAPDKKIRETLYLLIIAVCTSVLVRECSWLFRIWLWKRRHLSPTKKAPQPRIASRNDYFQWAGLHTILFLLCAIPLFAFHFSVSSNARKNVEPFVLGGAVGIITGDLISAGLVAGLEWWGDTHDHDFSVNSIIPLVILVVLAGIICTLHAFRTICALCGKDTNYLTYMKAVRWSFDAHSDQLAAQGASDAILASTARNPGVRVEADTEVVHLQLQKSEDADEEILPNVEVILPLPVKLQWTTPRIRCLGDSAEVSREVIDSG